MTMAMIMKMIMATTRVMTAYELIVCVCVCNLVTIIITVTCVSINHDVINILWFYALGTVYCLICASTFQSLIESNGR